MINYYKEQHKVSFSDVDSTLKLTLMNAVEINQNLISNYFYYNNLDNQTLKASHNSILVITRNIICFHKPIKWNDMLIGSSYMCLKTKYRTIVEAEFKNELEEVVMSSKSEACVIDYYTREVVPNSEIESLNKIEAVAAIHKIKNHNLNEEITSYLKAYELTVLPTDIDFSGHVNNAVYVRYALNSLDFDILSRIKIKQFEIHYIKEALINDKLVVFNKKEANSISFKIFRDDELIIQSKIIYEE